MLFEQNSEIFYIKDKYVEENSFIDEITYQSENREFKELKGELPEPIWEGCNSAIDMYYYAWEIAFRNIKKATKENGFAADFIDTAFNGRTFLWDSCFMLQFGKYGKNVFNFQHTLDNFYAKQHKDGFICKELEEETGLDAYTRFDMSGTGPNVFVFAEWQYYLQFGDKERLKKVFAPLMAYRNWTKLNRTWKDGSYFTNGIGSGMDNAPRLPQGYSTEFSHGHMSWVDATIHAYLNDKILIEIAKIIGREEVVFELEEEKEYLYNFINEKMWDEKTAFYYDIYKNGEWNYVKNIAPYWALYAGCVPQERIKPFIAHLDNENEFKTEHRIPSLSKDHPKFSKYGDYCNGSVLIPTNYITMLGLKNVGEEKLAYEIAENHYFNVLKCYENTGTLWENYKPCAAEPGMYVSGGENFSRKEFVGWTGIIPIAILIENIFGITYNSIKNEIVWHVRQTEKHGIKKYPFGNGGLATLICEKRDNEKEKPFITVKTNIPVRVKIIYGDNEFLLDEKEIERN